MPAGMQQHDNIYAYTYTIHTIAQLSSLHILQPRRPFFKFQSKCHALQGYFLLYESMLDTVLYARDKYLRPETGIMLPDKAVLFMCAIEDGEYRHEKVNNCVPLALYLVTPQFCHA
jgi:hypothetical protein